jgi:hypothetical protein
MLKRVQHDWELGLERDDIALKHFVIASEAKQSRAVYAALDCRGASPSAMTIQCNVIVL